MAKAPAPAPPPEPEKQLDPAIAADFERASKHGVDMTIFGLRLGEPVSLPHCPRSFSPFTLAAPCQRAKGDVEVDPLVGAFASLASALTDACPESGLTDDTTQVYFPSGKLPEGINGITAGLQAGRLVEVRVYADLDSDLVPQVAKKYGKPIQRSLSFDRPNGSTTSYPAFEWKKLNGLHAAFEPNHQQPVQGSGSGCLIVESEASVKARQTRVDRDDASRTKF
jgi:hypothetical protein